MPHLSPQSQPASHSLTCSPDDFISLAITKNIMAVDTETNGEDCRDGRGFAIGASCTVRDDEQDAYVSAYFPVAHTKNNISDSTKDMLLKLISSRILIMHNAKFDIVSIKTIGEYELKRYYCTMMMAHMLNENVPKGLDWLSKNELGLEGKHKPPEWVFMFNVYGWSPDFPAEIMALYACEDTILTYRLWERLYPFFVKAGFDGPM